MSKMRRRSRGPKQKPTTKELGVLQEKRELERLLRAEQRVVVLARQAKQAMLRSASARAAFARAVFDTDEAFRDAVMREERSSRELDAMMKGDEPHAAAAPLE